MISKKFIKSSFIYTLAGSLPMASAILLLPFYGRFLSPELMGAISVYFSFSLLIQIFVTYSFDSSFYINYHEFKADQRKLNSFISSAFLLIIFISLVTSLLLVIGGEWLLSMIFSNSEISFYPFGIISVVTGVFQAIQKVNNSLLQTQEKPTTFLWFNLLSFALIALFTIAGLYLYPKSLWGPIGGKLVATILSALWVLSYVYKQYGIHFNWELLKTTFPFNNTSLVYQLQQWIINFFDRPFILLFLPMATLGVYDLALKALVIIEFVLTGLNATFYPKIMSAVIQQEKKGTTIEINRYYHGLTAMAMILVAFSIFCLPWIIDIVFVQPGYHAAVPLLPFIGIIYLLRGLRLYMVMPYSAIKYSKPFPVFYSIILVFKIITLYILIGTFGIYGVIASTLLSYLLEIVVLYFGVRRKFTFRVNVAKMVIAPLSFAVLILILEPWLGAQYPNWLHGFYLLVVTILLGWAYRSELSLLFSKKLIR